MRKFIFVLTGILFLLAAAGLVIIGSGEKVNMFIILSSAAVPFLFTAYWNFYSVYYEKKSNSADGYFTYKGTGTAGIGVFYDKVIAVPFFLVLFGSTALAIAVAFLAANRGTEDIVIVMLCVSVLYSLLVTIYFTLRISKGVYSGNNAKAESTSDDFGYKIAFFFASVATLGVFPLVYFIIKSVRKNK